MRAFYDSSYRETLSYYFVVDDLLSSVLVISVDWASAARLLTHLAAKLVARTDVGTLVFPVPVFLSLRLRQKHGILDNFPFICYLINWFTGTTFYITIDVVACF